MRTWFTDSRRAWLWPILLAVLIFVASGRSPIAGPAIPHIDKITHFCVFGLLATLIVRLGRPLVTPLSAVIIVSLYGVSDEFRQSFTAGRMVEAADWLADTLGAAVAVAAYTQLRWYRSFLELPVRGKSVD